MYKLYVNGKFHNSYLSLEVALVDAKKYLKDGDDIEIRIKEASFAAHGIYKEIPAHALPN